MYPGLQLNRGNFQRFLGAVNPSPANVVFYGADPTGIADSLAAFNAALAVDGSIFVPAGTYLLSGPLAISGRREISVVGEGRGLAILKFTTGGIVATIPTSLTTDIYASVTFRNLTIMTDAAGTSIGLEILSPLPTNMMPTLDNLEFIGSDGVHGPSQNVTGTSHTSTTIDGIASTAGILVNSTVVGSGVSDGTYVTVVGANSVTLNQATTTSTTATFSFNAGPQKYWNIGIEIEGGWFPSITNVRVSGGGPGRTDKGIYIHDAPTDPMFDYFLSHLEIQYCTTPLRIDGQVEGIMLSQFDFYSSRDGIVATHATGIMVGTWQISDGTIFCSRNPFSTNRFSQIQLSNITLARGVTDPPWCPQDAGAVFSAPFGGWYYPGKFISVVDNLNLTVAGLIFFNAFANTTDYVYLENATNWTINGLVFYTGTSTNGINIQGTSQLGSFDNINSFGTITNPLVFGGSTGAINRGSFFHNGVLIRQNLQALDGDFTGSVTVSVNIIAVGLVGVGASAPLVFAGRSKVTSPLDSYFLFTNNAGTDFTQLQFGGSTAAFPSLVRSGTTLKARLADNSGDAPFTVAALTLSGSLSRTAPVTKTGDFAVAVTENWLINNKAGSSCVVTLPSAATFVGREIMFVNYQAFSIDSVASNVKPISGGALGITICSASAGSWAILVSDGTNWIKTAGG